MKLSLNLLLRNEQPYAVVLFTGGFIHILFSLSYVTTTDLIAAPILAVGMSLIFFITFLVNRDSPLTERHKELFSYLLGGVHIAYILLSDNEDQALLVGHFYPFFVRLLNRRWLSVNAVYGVCYIALLFWGLPDFSFGVLEVQTRLLLFFLYILETWLIYYFAKQILDAGKEQKRKLQQAESANRQLVELFNGAVVLARDTTENLSIIIKELEDVAFVDTKYTKNLRGCANNLRSIYDQYLFSSEKELSRFNLHDFLVSLVRSNFSEFMQEIVPRYILDEDVPAEIIANSKRLADTINGAIQNYLWTPIHQKLPFEIKTTYLGSQEVKYVLVQLRCGNIPYPDIDLLQKKRQEELEDLLGLQIFVQEQHGDLQVEKRGNEDVRGTLVSFFVQVLEDVQDFVANPHPQMAVSLRGGHIDFETARENVKGLKILLAEDNEINQKVLTFLLQNYVAAVEVVPDGRKLLQRLSEQSFDLILMDVQMPYVNGLQATKRIREVEHQNGGHIPIIALTAYTQPSERKKCLQLGMDEYLCKPFEEEHLVMLMANVLERAIPYATDIKYEF